MIVKAHKAAQAISLAAARLERQKRRRDAKPEIALGNPEKDDEIHGDNTSPLKGSKEGAVREHRARALGLRGLAAVPFGDALFVIAGCTARGLVMPRSTRQGPLPGRCSGAGHSSSQPIPDPAPSLSEKR